MLAGSGSMMTAAISRHARRTRFARAASSSSGATSVSPRHRGRNARAVGLRHLGEPRAGADQHRIGVAVIAAVELQDPVARPVARARHAQRRHHGFGAGVHEADALHPRDARGDQLGELERVGFGGAVGPAATERAVDRGAHIGILVAEDAAGPKTCRSR